MRRVVEVSGLPWSAPAPFDPAMTLGQALMVPTRIYVPALLALHRAGLLKAAAHITGGGLPGNLPRVLPDDTVAVLEPYWSMPPVFGWLARTGGVAPAEMLRVFNCGIGMAVVVADPDAATELLRDQARASPASAGSKPAAARPEVRIDLPAGWPG